MTTELVRSQGSSLSDKIAYAQAMSSASLLPKHYQKQPANLLFALEYADALGVTPIHAITSIYVVDGKPTASADLISALVRKAGHRLRISGDDTVAVAELIRADDPDHTFRVEWTMDRARAAGLAGKAVWKNYPAAMLRSRAITEVARAGASDALFGVIYTPEELGAEVTAEGDPVAPMPTPASEPAGRKQTIRRDAAPQPDLPAAVLNAPKEDDDVVDEAPATTVEPGCSRSQQTKLGKALQANGHTTKEEMLRVTSTWVGREVSSSADLTVSEANDFTKELEDAAAGQNTDGVIADEPASEADAAWMANA